MSECEPTLLSESTDRHSDIGAACDAAASVPDVGLQFDEFGFRLDDEAKPTFATTTSSTTTTGTATATMPTTAVRWGDREIEKREKKTIFNLRIRKGSVECVGAARRQQRVVARTGRADRVDAVASPEQSAFDFFL
jgi:hypothetical protein